MALKYAQEYLQQSQDYDHQKSILNAKKKKHERSIERINKKLDTLELQRPGWIDSIIKPIAEDMIRYLPGRYYEILGPFGIGARTAIHFYKDEVKGLSGIDKVTHGNCISITFEPVDLREGIIKLVDYTRDLKRFSPGTIGELNGFNHPTVDIPDDADARWFIKWMNEQERM